MQITTLSQLIPILQTAISPVILISGIGLLLLTMTNRLGRAVDRARSLHADIISAEGSSREKIAEQIQILWKRTHSIRLAITLASLSALLSSTLIVAIFVSTLWQVEIAGFITLLFMVSIGCLMGSLVMFIYDINNSLTALKIELGDSGINKT